MIDNADDSGGFDSGGLEDDIFDIWRAMREADWRGGAAGTEVSFFDHRGIC